MNNTSNQTITFKEKSFCITGEFLTPQKDGEKPLTRNMVSKMVEAKGGITKKTVIKSLEKAEKYEVPTQSWEEFIKEG